MALWASIQWHTAADVFLGHPYLIITVALFIVPLLIIVSDYVDGMQKRIALGDIPSVDEGSNMSPLLRLRRTSFNLEEELKKAYSLYTKKGKPFAVRAPNGEYAYMLPPQSSKTWRNLPSEQLSFMHLVSEVNGINKHTHMTSRTQIDAITAYGKKFHDLVVKETDKYLPPAFTTLDDGCFHEFNTVELVRSITAKIVTSFLVGPESSRDTEFVDLLVSYNDYVNTFTATYFRYPRITRAFVERFSRSSRGLRTNILSLKEKLIPEIQLRIKVIRSGQRSSTCLLLDALIDQSFVRGIFHLEKEGGAEREQIDLLAQETMFLFFETAGPIALVLTGLLYRVMATSDYIAPLREEIMKALDNSGGEWTYGVFKNMPKLESFTREVLRLHGPTLYSVSRRVMKPLTLSSVGLALRPGSLISLPARCIHIDPDLYNDPMAFDGYRFYDATSNSCSPQMLTTSNSFLAFGQGSALCPGRLIGIIPSHVIFAKILLDFDLKFADQRKEFPPNVITDGNNALDSTTRMHIRKRQTAD